MSDLAVFLPRTLHGLARPALGGEDAFRRVRGALLFCDVAGFTPLTEALSVLGKEGAEELTRLLNGYFTRMIGIIEAEGGDVLRFGGDAMAVLFPGERPEPSLRAAHRMMAAMGEFSSLETRAGTFKLSMKIGAAFGEVLLGILADGAGNYEFYASGDPLDDSADAEHHAQAGLVVCHPSAVRACGAGVPLGPLKEGYRILGGPVEGGAELPQWGPAPSRKDLARLMPPFLGEYTARGATGEHRGTAVLFASFKGVLPARGEIAPKEVDAQTHRRLQTAFWAFQTVARRYGGVVNKLDMGDKGAKAILLFGSPQALENKEEMAARSALDLLRGGVFPEGVTLRMGLTSAPLFTGPVGSPSRREYTVMGDGINLAARLMQAAGPGQILCDGRVASGAPALLFEELSPISVKGKREPVVPFVPLGERGEEEGRAGALVEREALCRELKDYLLKGQGKPFALSGEAGSGKTALLEWARWEVRRRGSPASLVTLGPFSQEKPLAAWRPHLRYLLGLHREDSPAAARQALASALAPEPAEYRPLLYPLLDLIEEEGEALRNLSPKERKDLTFAILGRVLARSGPRALLVDNLQWADPLSLEFLDFLLEDPEPPPWKLAVSLRPGSPDAEAHLGAFRREELAPLSPSGVEAYLRKRHGFAEVEKGVLDWFTARSRGNPAVAAALVLALEGAGLITRDTYGARVDADRLFQTAFPDTLEGLYLARVEGLPPRSKVLLQQASVLGAAVSGNLLVHLSRLDGEAFAGAVAPLTAGGILLEDTWGSRPYYRFADGLLRDAVYESLPFALKREAHLRVAEFLQPGAESNARLWPTLAHHFQQAGEDLRARVYHRLAGRDAAARSDNLTALKHLEFVCREITAKVDDVEDTFRLLDVYSFLGRREEARAALERLDPFQESLAPSHLGRLQYFLAREAFHEHNWCEVEARLLDGLKQYEAAGDITGVGKSYVNLVGLVYGPTGKLDRAKECLEKALALPEGPDQEGFRILAQMNMGIVYRHLGESTKALKWLQSAYRGAVRFGFGLQQGNIADNICNIFSDTGQFSRASAWGRRALNILNTFAARRLAQNAQYNLSLAYLASGWSLKVKRLLTSVLQQAERGGLLQVVGSTAQGLSQAAAQQLDFSYCLGTARRALGAFQELQNGRDYRFSLLGPVTLFQFLGATREAKDFFGETGAFKFLKSTPADASTEPRILRVIAWMEGRDRVRTDAEAYFCEGVETSPEEGLERLLWGAQIALEDRDTRRGIHLLARAIHALDAWPHFDAMVRYFCLCSLVGELSSAGEKEACKLLRRSPGGVWGMRLLCLLVRKERRGEERQKLLRTAQKRLNFCREHSPDWAWTKIASFPEVAAVLKECDGDRGSRKRGAGSRKEKTATMQKRA